MSGFSDKDVNINDSNDSNDDEDDVENIGELVLEILLSSSIDSIIDLNLGGNN